MQRRSILNSALALAALAVGLEPLLVRYLGRGAPAWSHWWCSASSASSAPASPGAAASAPHIASGGLGGALGGGVRATLEVLAVHWPHFLPIVAALGAVAYLWRADARYRAVTSSGTA